MPSLKVLPGKFVRLPDGSVVKGRLSAEGDFFPSVTSVLSLLPNPFKPDDQLAPEHRRRREAALEFGTRVHALLESVGRNGCTPRYCACEEEVPPALEEYHRGIVWFMEQYVDEVLRVEREYISTKLMLSGTVDLVARLQNGKIAAIDYKTGSVYRTHPLQLMGYTLLLHDHGIEVDERLVLRFPKDRPGQWIVDPYSDHEEDYRVFTGLLDAYHWHYKTETKHMKAVAMREGY